MKNAGGLPGGGGRPEEKTLFVTLWDLSLPTSEAIADGARRVLPRSVEFPLVADGAQVWVRPEGATEWTLGPVAAADVTDPDEDAQRVVPTAVEIATLLPAAKGNRFEIGVEPQNLRGLQLGGYYSSPDCYVATRDAQRLVKILQWGTAQWREMYEAFADCSNMQIVAEDLPDLSRCDSLHSAFMGSGVVEGFERWDVGKVTDMTALFYGCASLVGKSVAEWDVRNVDSMAMMFMECEHFDGKLGHWDVSSVLDFSSIFSGCSAFRGRGVERWKVQKEANREGAFDGCFSLVEGLPVWMGGGESADDERYSDDGEMREERVRKFRKGPTDDD